MKNIALDVEKDVPAEVLQHMHRSVFNAFTRITINHLNTKDNEFYLVSQTVAKEVPLKRVGDKEVLDDGYFATIKNNYAKTIVHAKGLANVRATLISYQKRYIEMNNMFIIEHDKSHKGVNLIRHCKDLFLKYSDFAEILKSESITVPVSLCDESTVVSSAEEKKSETAKTNEVSSPCECDYNNNIDDAYKSRI